MEIFNLKPLVWSHIKQIIMSNLQALEVVGRGSETQLEVAANLKKII